ncbi:MAG TPA: phosphatidylglycerophosphatase A [Acidimicrobiia bacterium]|nr:phosphatidylglycerophosphatase A [Acidimicrobiia bacterium]
MHRVVASWFGTGLILGRVRGSHLGSGTVGALFALPVALVVGHWFEWQGQVVAAVLVVAASVWSTRPFVGPEGDAGWICVDEAAGAFIAVIGLAIWPAAIVAWLIFRAADIFKNFAPGVARAERLPGAVGVTADDVVAGLYGLAAGHLLEALL